MYELHSEDPALELTPGRYALVLKNQAYDFTIEGQIIDPKQCIERIVATDGTFYRRLQEAITLQKTRSGTYLDLTDLSFSCPNLGRWRSQMLPLRLLLIAPLVLASPALAQGTQQQGVKNRPSKHLHGLTLAGSNTAEQQPVSEPHRSGCSSGCVGKSQPEQ